jgi:formate dehydrogenase maturation protein FdhE
MTDITKPTLTSEEYVAKGGGCCPFCGSGDLTGRFIEVDGRTAAQPVDCNNCEAEWIDMYTLTGYQV